MSAQDAAVGLRSGAKFYRGAGLGCMGAAIIALIGYNMLTFAYAEDAMESGGQDPTIMDFISFG